MPVETAGFGVLSTIGVLLFIGACGKSAQIPLYVWLPDAMEGPTPVSALIHAATMVTAGVYMVARNAVLFSHAPTALLIVAVVGVLTALLAASIGLVQTDIKRVLAYSTVSQLGYMFLALGVGAFAAGAFHLMTHAFFKALLFLASGAVIHAMAGEQNMLKMGNLRGYLPITYRTMMIGTLAIAGIPPLAGFFSKDEILFRTFSANRVLWVIAAVTALMTAFYMFRLMSLTFFGRYRGPAFAGEHGAAADGGGHQGHDAHGSHDAHGGHGGHGEWHGPHEAPKAMSYVLIVLAIGSALAGFAGVPAALWGNNAIEHFLAPSFETPTAVAAGVSHAAAEAAQVAEAGVVHAATAHNLAADPAQLGVSHAAAEGEHAAQAAHMSWGGEIGLMVLSVAIGLIGIFAAYRSYVARPEIADGLKRRFATAHRWLTNKYYVDELYDATVVRGTMNSADGLWTFDAKVVDGAVNGSGWFTIFSSWISHLADKHIVDGLVNLVGRLLHEASYLFRRLQSGLIQNYALLMVFGVFVFLGVYLFVR
jgi:NADH-quinone oxidoreductase subunit L